MKKKTNNDDNMVPLSELATAQDVPTRESAESDEAKTEKKNKNITCDVIKVFSESDARGGVVRVQIVSWNKRSPMFEKREYYTNEEGKEKMGKAKGMNLEDLDLIWENKEEIEKIMDKDSWKKKPSAE